MNNATDYDHTIRKRSRAVLNNYIHGLQEDPPVHTHQSIQRWEVQISHDHSNRVVLELLQNAYDQLKGYVGPRVVSSQLLKCARSDITGDRNLRMHM